MNTLVLIAIIIVFVFALTYDPKSRRLDKYIAPEQNYGKQQQPQKLMPSPCASDRYHDVQFNSEPSISSCAGKPREIMGAII